MAPLPPAIAVEEDDLPAYALSMAVLEHHSVQDVEFPLAFSSLGFDHKTVAKILGTELWLAAYPKEAPTQSNFIPRRILGALKVAMGRLAIATEVRDKVAEADVTAAVALAASNYDDWRAARAGEEQAKQGPY